MCYLIKFLNEKQINLYLLDKGMGRKCYIKMRNKEYWELMYDDDIYILYV